MWGYNDLARKGGLLTNGKRPLSISGWTSTTEVEAAFEKEDRQKGLVLFLIRLDDAVMETDRAWAAKIRREKHIGDFRNWKDRDSFRKAFDRLLRDLKACEKSAKSR